MIDLIAHLTRQATFSRATFGPGPRTKGVIDHLKKEFREIMEVYEGGVKGETRPQARPTPPLTRGQDIRAVHAAAADEWTDVAILGLDGLLRAISAAHPDWTFDRVAEEAARKIVAKQGKNELRDWPDWRTMSADSAIEHDRSKD